MIIIINQDSAKPKEYRANFSSNNNEINLYHLVNFGNLNNIGFLSGCIYTNINKTRQNPYLKLNLTINNIQIYLIAEKNTNLFSQNSSQPIIMFNLRGNQIVLNN